MKINTLLHIFIIDVLPTIIASIIGTTIAFLLAEATPDEWLIAIVKFCGSPLTAFIYLLPLAVLINMSNVISDELRKYDWTY